MIKNLTLSVLDIGPIRSNQTASDCFTSMIHLAKFADQLGYHRYWLAEHHNVAAVAASHTSVFSSTIGANTQNIRIGGCVLLPHYPPFLVAEQMGLVEACFPGRVDMGIGRSTGADWSTSSLLRGTQDIRAAENHLENVNSLLTFSRPGGFQVHTAQRDLKFQVVPNSYSSPTPWILGTSAYSAALAADLGLPYAFGYHIHAEGAKEAIQLYKDRFKPSERLQSPQVLVSAIVVIGETEEEARRLAKSQLYFMSAFRSGEPVGPQLLVEEAEEVIFPPRYDSLVSMFLRSWIIGSPKTAGQAISDLASELGVSEMMINPVAASFREQPTDRALNRDLTLLALAEQFPQRNGS